MCRMKVAAVLLGSSVVANATVIDDALLQQIGQQRFGGDRTGACVALAVVEQQVARAVVCADPAQTRAINADTAFEIGSVSKTFNGALLAQLEAEGKLKLDDPLQQHLPASVKVPSFDGQPITLRHLLTHTSGLPPLPPGFAPRDPENPYAELAPKALFAGLAKVKLAAAPGSRFGYSNMGAMLLSWVVAERAGEPYDRLLQKSLLAPLAMQSSFVTRPAKGVALAQGHLPTGEVTPGWDFHPALAGVGGIRASLNDMVRYVEAQLGRGPQAQVKLLAAARREIAPPDGQRMAYGWMIAPLNGEEIYVHEGGTGGFSSFVAFRADGSRGVVVLADTAMTALGGLSSIGLHLLDQRVPLGAPRRAVAAPAELLEQLAGEYRLQGGMRMSLRRAGKALEIQAEGQDAYEMGYDSAGEFYPLTFDAILRPQVQDGRVSFLWLQGGGAVPASRVDGQAAAAPDAAALAAYAGSYALKPGFALTVFVEQGQLMAQATGQGAFELQPTQPDVFRADAYGIEIVFSRDAAGAVAALALNQAGHTLRGQRR